MARVASGPQHCFGCVVDSAPILGRLVRAELVRHDTGRFYLHPIHRSYALARVPAGWPGDGPLVLTLAALRAQAADYYAQIRTPDRRPGPGR